MTEELRTKLRTSIDSLPDAEGISRENRDYAIWSIVDEVEKAFKDAGYMAGQEFYERFIKELEHTDLTGQRYAEADAAARRAAGMKS